MQSSRHRQTILLFLILFWVLFILGGYYYFHKPVSPAAVSALLSVLLDLVFLALFAGVAGGLGRRLLPAENIPALERSALQFALGAGVLSFVWFALGVAGLYRFPLAAPLLILCVILLRRQAREWYASFGAIGAAWRQAGWVERTAAGLSGVLVFDQLLIALAPPIKWDALAYHLQIPRQYLAAGGIVFLPENPYWGHPQIVETLYTLAMSFHRAETAAVLGWGAGLIFLTGILGFTTSQLVRITGETAAAEYPPRRFAVAGWIAVAAVMAGTTYRYLMGWSYTDLFAALFGLAALVTFFAWLDDGSPKWLLWTGLFCGFAVGVKWTEGLLPLGLAAAGLWFARGRGLRFNTWLLAGSILLLTVLPWLVKNTIATGSPLYPFIFGTQWIDAARIAQANQPPQIDNLWRYLLAPLTTTWTGVDSAPGFATDLGPLLLLFAVPGLWLYRRSTKAFTLLALLVLATLSLGLVSLRFGHLEQPRLYFALLPALVLPCGWGWEWLQRQLFAGVRLRRILSAMIFLVMGLVFWQDSLWMARLTPEKVVFGAETRQAYLENTLGYTVPAMEALENLPPGSRTLMLWEPRGFYAPSSAQADLWIDRWRTDRRLESTAAAIQGKWLQEGYTHLLVYLPGIEFIRPQPGQAPGPDWTAFEDLQARLPAPVSIGGVYSLYSLK